jgi:hypothetical protein
MDKLNGTPFIGSFLSYLQPLFCIELDLLIDFVQPKASVELQRFRFRMEALNTDRRGLLLCLKVGPFETFAILFQKVLRLTSKCSNFALKELLHSRVISSKALLEQTMALFSLTDTNEESGAKSIISPGLLCKHSARCPNLSPTWHFL